MQPLVSIVIVCMDRMDLLRRISIKTTSAMQMIWQIPGASRMS